MNQAAKQQQRFITVSVRDLELNQVEDKPPLNDISCCLTVFTEEKDSKNVNNQFFDLLLLNDPQNSAKFKLLKGENQFLKVQLKTLSSQRLIATVNISLSIFAESNNISIDQWINLSVLQNGDSSPHVSSQKQSYEGNARIKMRFVVNEQDNAKKVEDPFKTPVDTERVNLNTTLQPCVNFPIKDEKRKYDFTPILNREELEQTQQSIHNIESRLVLTPERQRIMENSAVFQNKFQELIEKLMETKNQSLILGVTRQLNESHRKDLEKNNLTEILKRLNESQNYIEDDLIENNDQYLNNINLSLSGIHQLSKKQGSPEQTRRNKCDLEGEIAKLRLELEKKQEIEQLARDLKLKLFNQERNNENLLNQYNKAVDNYQKYFAEINQENLELKKKIVAIEKESQQKDKIIQELKDSFEDKLKQEKSKLQKEIMQQNLKKDLQEELLKESELKELTQDQMSQKIHDILIKHKQEISQYSQLLLESQNESVEYQAKMIEMQKEIEILQQKFKNQSTLQGDNSTTINNPSLLSNSDIQNLEKSSNCQTNSSKKYTEEEFAYFEKIIKDKSLRLTQLETEKAQIEFSLQKAEMKIKQLNENISSLESQLQSSSESKSEDFKAISDNLKAISEENAKLKTQIEESEQLRSTLEDHLLKTKQNFSKKLEELQQKQQQTNNEAKINKTKDESASMKKLVEELNQKSTFINELTYQNKDYKVKLQTQQEKIKILEFNQSETEQLKKAVSDLESEKEKINMDLYAVTEDLLKKTTESISQQQVITQLSAEVKRLEKMIEDLLLRNPSHQLNYNAKKGDEIDEKLCEFLSNNVTPIKFVRIDEGLYNFGTKRIIVKLLKGKLVCRVGGGFMVIEEFLQLYTLQELIKMKQTGDYSLLNYPISEEKIDQLIQQDIQFNQQQYKQLSEQTNQVPAQNFNQGTPKQQLENLQTQQSQQNNYGQNPLRNSSNYNQIQQSQAQNISDNYSQQYAKHQNPAAVTVTPAIQKSRDFDNIPSQENIKISIDECQKENQQCRSSIELNQTPSKTENIYQKSTNFTQCMQQQQQLSQQNNNISNHTPVYHNRSIRISTNQQPTQLFQTQEERAQQVSQHEKNQEMLKYLIEQAHHDVHLRNELESLQSSIQLAANIKGSEIMRKYSQNSQNTNQQLQTFENVSNTLSNNQNNQNNGSSQKQYTIDFTNSNYNYHAQQNVKTSFNGNNSRISSVITNSSSRPPNTYSIRATPQKQAYQQVEQFSANTSAINEFTPQHMNGSKAATPKRNNDLAQSAYQERIFRQYSHKRNAAENFSPYSHNRHSSITSTFSAQKKSYYLQKQ
ncbi:growth-arrest-specific protein 2 domain protein (macronuclear) [Tetrahymena thermophila SB210]|uniref:Growth-arrest-specific protein 2 domain protein n=1 Tax=Tetrahymena thermophila (strain SB210) TaxID=312017 RepID=Q239A0_TETTS|nr:growth-arrest-specific protein 2 domain protein [Tetrahymena thermophila SB210]EAR93070.1 growth-arrest-specific protein 2 domain protein [Tetrahymena thermophila SB210]|eukprot:XP_001013315.1 growth-arrest-specific protein 2 domain protein [Tetrahymena thermophila SB210]